MTNPVPAAVDPDIDGVDAWLDANWDPQLTVRDWWARLAGAGLVLVGGVVALGLVGLPAMIALLRRTEPSGESIPLPPTAVESLAS